jgi:signal transduction histidine kinase
LPLGLPGLSTGDLHDHRYFASGEQLAERRLSAGQFTQDPVKFMDKPQSIASSNRELPLPLVLFIGSPEGLLEKLDLPDQEKLALHSQRPFSDLLAPEYSLVCRLNGLEALDQLARISPDLIIADFVMSDVEEFVQKLRARSENSHVPVLLLTSSTDRKTGARLLTGGVQDYLVTPFLLEELRARSGNLIAMKRAQDEAIENTLRVEEARQELESFSYSVSHDLRAPLRAMQGLANALLEDYEENLDEVGKDYARRIVGASKRMDQLVTDLLNYSRLARGDLQIQPLSLEDVVQEARNQLESEFDHKQVQFSLDRAPVKALGQRAILVQVVCNLLSNSLKFVANGVQPHIRVQVEDKRNWVRLSIQDNGIGIAKEDHERIFRVFERLHTPAAYPGTGIGLAIVTKGIKRLGGRLGLESAPDQGSTFWFELPKASDD